ncbi:MAG: hypothetical protein PCFJNLEI_02260 [Verrucomicrobiae bacterium]|nr:hypothetical protein [Verrucomicrobiae bacterium]
MDTANPQWTLPTATKVDVGRWWQPARLWAVGTETELLLVAAGPRPVVVRVPLTDLRASLYNAVTGEVILAPATGVPYRCLKLAPVEGHQLLAQIQQKETSSC